MARVSGDLPSLEKHVEQTDAAIGAGAVHKCLLLVTCSVSVVVIQ